MKRKPKKKPDAFAQDKIKGEYEKPGPKVDPDGARIAAALDKIMGRTVAPGFVVNWRPAWAKEVPTFDFYFHVDGLAVDFFGQQNGELDALEDDLTPAQRTEIAQKGALCRANATKYIALGPEDELSEMQLAAAVGRAAVKKGPKAVAVGDGIEEEETNEF